MSGRGEPEIPVGLVRRAHGISGAVLVAPLTDVPESRYVPGAELSAGAAGLLTIAEVRPHKAGLLVSFVGVTDRNRAETLRGETLTIPRAHRRPLGRDEFWEEDLIGLEAVDPAGARLGVVSGVVTGRAQDRLVIRTEAGGAVEVPFVGAIVGEVSIEAGRVVIDPPEGLF